MFIFFCIALAGAAFLVLTSWSGHGDVDHDVSVDHDIDHDVDHEGATMSFISPRIIALFITAFGGVGTIVRWQGTSMVLSGVLGTVIGALITFIGYFLLGLVYKQQADSLVKTSTLVGEEGVVIVGISENSVGKVSVMSADYLVQSVDGKPIKEGEYVKVVKTFGSTLIVEKVKKESATN